jgi:hypothetical protein
VTHVEALTHLLYAEDADVDGQFCIDIAGCLLEVDGLGTPVDDVAVVELETGRDAVAKGVHPLVRSSRPRPLDPPQTAHVRLQHEPVLTQHVMDCVLDGVGSIALVLQSKEFFTVVSEENSHFNLEAFGAAIFVVVVGLHVKE